MDDPSSGHHHAGDHHVVDAGMHLTAAEATGENPDVVEGPDATSADAEALAGSVPPLDAPHTGFLTGGLSHELPPLAEELRVTGRSFQEVQMHIQRVADLMLNGVRRCGGVLCRATSAVVCSLCFTSTTKSFVLLRYTMLPSSSLSLSLILSFSLSFSFSLILSHSLSFFLILSLSPLLRTRAAQVEAYVCDAGDDDAAPHLDQFSHHDPMQRTSGHVRALDPTSCWRA